MIKEEIERLREEVIKHDLAYEKGEPIITDTEYDQLYNRLVHLESENPHYITPDSPTQRIYSVVLDELSKVKHPTPLLSLEKATTEEDLLRFLNRFDEGTKFSIGNKEDGLTVRLSYEDGNLIQASTRGSGFEGEDITHTMRLLPSVPNYIPEMSHVEIRGEAVIPYEDFKRVNTDGKYKSPRNLVSGSIRTLEARTARDRGVKFFAFDLLNGNHLGHDTESESRAFLENWGFTLTETRQFINSKEGKQEIIEHCLSYAREERDKIDHMIDGLVIKVDDYLTRIQKGTTSKYPKWAIAFKFDSMDATTVIKGYINTVGKTGKITPNAILDPVEIDGVTIQKASLANFANIKKRDIRVGDTVVIARANDVIPQVVSVVEENRTGNEIEIEVPSKCPTCHDPLKEEWGKDGDGNEAVTLYCINPKCPDQQIRVLEHFVSKSGLDIDGLGAETVRVLYENNLVSDIPSIYQLHDKKDKLLQLERFGEKKVTKLLQGVEQSKQKPLQNVLRSLGIRNIGDNVSKILTKEFTSWVQLKDAVNSGELETYLDQADGIGTVLKETILEVFKDEKVIQTFDQLGNVGFTLEQPVEDATSYSEASLEGLSFVITGKLSKARGEIKKQIEQAGGKVTGSVTSKTSYLVLGGYNDETGEFEGTMSSKHKGAIEKEVPIISETKLGELLKG